MPGPRRSGIFELRHHIFENLVQEVAKLERIEGKRFIRLLRFRAMQIHASRLVPKLGQPRHPQAPAYGPWGCRKHRH